MAFRDRSIKDKVDSFDFRVLEVVARRDGGVSAAPCQIRVMTVDNHLDTLQFVQDHMETWIDNLFRLPRIQAEERVSDFWDSLPL